MIRNSFKVVFFWRKVKYFSSAALRAAMASFEFIFLESNQDRMFFPLTHTVTHPSSILFLFHLFGSYNTQ